MDETTPEPSPETAAMLAIVDAWKVETFFNRGLDAPEFNRITDAVDNLKRRLAAAKE